MLEKDMLGVLLQYWTETAAIKISIQLLTRQIPGKPIRERSDHFVTCTIPVSQSSGDVRITDAGWCVSASEHGFLKANATGISTPHPGIGIALARKTPTVRKCILASEVRKTLRRNDGTIR